MARNIKLSDLKDLEGIEWYKPFETIQHKDENIANNRLFVWNFDADDIEEFIRIFEAYKSEPYSVSARLDFNGRLLRKMKTMLRDGYNPIECMLYASKTVNIRLQSDKELQTVLAERIREIYTSQKTETIKVFHNIIDMWTWIPQLKTVITAIGMIGDNDELLDAIFSKFGEDNLLRATVFHAFMHNKSEKNLDRAMRLIAGLHDTDDDAVLGRIFRKEIGGFGNEAAGIVEKYYEMPGVSFAGSKIIRRIRLDINDGKISVDDRLYRNNLASKSRQDDALFRNFMEDCNEKNDETALYLCRFSRIEAAEYVKARLESGEMPRREKNTAIVSLAALGKDGYTSAAGIVQKYKDDEDCRYAVITGMIMMRDETYADELADILSSFQDYQLKELYDVLKGAGVTNYLNEHGLIRNALCKKFNELVSCQRYDELETLSSNLQMFWNSKLFNLISDDLLIAICQFLNKYAAGEVSFSENIGISLIEIIVNKYNESVQNVLFSLYHSAPGSKIRELSYKKLKNRHISPPR